VVHSVEADEAPGRHQRPDVESHELAPARIAGTMGEDELGTVPRPKSSEDANDYREQETVSHARSQLKPRDDYKSVRVDKTSRHKYGDHNRY
jgi:hypothetical protein